MKFIKSYKIFESNQSHSEVKDYVESMMVDMEDYGYGYQVTAATKSMIPSNGKKEEIIDIHIWKKNSDTVDIELLQDRIAQVAEIIKPDGFLLNGFRIRPGFNFRVSMPKSIYFNSLEDYSIKKIFR